MFQFVPDVERLTSIFSQATAPTFFLGAVAAFVSLMSGRLSGVMARLQKLNRAEDHAKHPFDIKSEMERLRRRARLLSSGIASSLMAGICATILLVILFGSEFFGLHYAYGAAVVFTIATLSLGFALVRFYQEARLGLAEADEYD
jgi:hypothetical protein